MLTALNGQLVLFHRCLFDKKRFAEENDLSLVGVTWFESQKDDWVRMKLEKPESEVCAGREGYSDPCPTGGASIAAGSMPYVAAILLLLKVTRSLLGVI